MNHLAHAYLSFNNPEILVGNMIADYVKGKQKFEYPIEIQNGIALHHAIDTFTDTHIATRNAKQFFKADYRLYAGAFVDVSFDHFLANDTNEFESENKLIDFTKSTYQILNEQKNYLPKTLLQMLPYMESQNWLYNYRFTSGLQKSFERLAHRAKYLTESAKAFDSFNKHYLEIEQCYQQLFKDLKFFFVNNY